MNRTLQLRQLLTAHPWAWGLSLLLGLISLGASLLLLAVSGWFITACAAAGLASAWAGAFDYLRPSAVIRLCAISRTAGRYAERLQSHALMLRLLTRLRLQSFNAFANQSFARLSQHISSDTLQRLIRDLELLDQFPIQVVNRVLSLCLLLGALLVACLVYLPSSTFSLLLLALGCLLLPLAILPVTRRLQHQRWQLQQQRRNLMLQTFRMLTSHLLFATAPRCQHQLQQVELQLLGCEQRQQRWQLAVQLTQLPLMLLGLGCILLSAEASAAVQIGISLAWLGLCEQLLGLSYWPQHWVEARLASQRLPLAEAPSLPAHQPHASIVNERWRLQLHQVSIGIEHPLLHAIEVEAQTGDVVLLTGASGSGKSVLLQSIAAEWPLLAGQCLLNQQPITEGMVHYVGQRADCFGLSIAADLRLAKPHASDDELREVLHAVGLADWLDRQPHGLTTVLGDYGIGLSGGETRRFALARAFLRQQPILLLDEPFAGLDTASAEQLLQQIVQRQQHGLVIIASHQQHHSSLFSHCWAITADGTLQPSLRNHQGVSI